jgi:hypothetical protein
MIITAFLAGHLTRIKEWGFFDVATRGIMEFLRQG